MKNLEELDKALGKIHEGLMEQAKKARAGWEMKTYEALIEAMRHIEEAQAEIVNAEASK